MTQLTNVFQDNVDHPDLLCLQEVGGLKGIEHVQGIPFSLGKQSYIAYALDTKESWRGVCLAARHELTTAVEYTQAHPFGVLAKLAMHGVHWYFASLHFPHDNREAAEDPWNSGIQLVEEFVMSARMHDRIVLACDINQDFTQELDSFVPLARLRACLNLTGLDVVDPGCNTWFGRGLSTKIDFFLVRLPALDYQVHVHHDLRESLPSDHSGVGLTLYSTCPFFRRRPWVNKRCGRWLVDENKLRTQIQTLGGRLDQGLLHAFAKASSTRMPSLRYSDPPEVKDLIRQRKVLTGEARTCKMQEIRTAREAAQIAHKQDLLQRARQGDRVAIAHMRRSAGASLSEGSYVQRAGGHTAAVHDLKAFYAAKFSSRDPTPLDSLHDALHAKHESASFSPVSKQEFKDLLDKTKNHTSTGPDGISYEVLKHVLAFDTQDLLPLRFTKLLGGEEPIPKEWKEGKITFLPKVTRPIQPSQLRPICLTSTVCKLFGKLLSVRLRSHLPEFRCAQLGARKGCQVLDGITTAQIRNSLF